MEIDKESLEEFKKLWKKEFGEKLSDEEARPKYNSQRLNDTSKDANFRDGFRQRVDRGVQEDLEGRVPGRYLR